MRKTTTKIECMPPAWRWTCDVWMAGDKICDSHRDFCLATALYHLGPIRGYSGELTSNGTVRPVQDGACFCKRHLLMLCRQGAKLLGYRLVKEERT